MIQKPRVALGLSVPKFGSNTEFFVIRPSVITAKWTRNNHLVADVLTVTMSWREAGVDPRTMKNGRVSFWLWDGMVNPNGDPLPEHLRFTGICKKAKRSMGSDGMNVDMTFHDYTDMFINMKPFPNAGMPEYSDTLDTAWKKICDNTGWMDEETHKIVSSVKVLRENLKIEAAGFQGKTLGSAVPKRFHEIARPQPKDRSSAWEVWQYCCGMLGLISYIQGDECIVRTSTEHYTLTNPAVFLHGGEDGNITEFEEEADTNIDAKGILLKSFNPITGVVMESHYPPPSDERIKRSRADAKRAKKAGREVNDNETSSQYEEFEFHTITDQATLDHAVKEAYEQRSRQEIKGSFKTGDMWTTQFDTGGAKVDVLDLTAGDAVLVALAPENLETLKSFGSKGEQVAYLTTVMNYSEETAQLIIANSDADEINKPLYHVEALEVSLSPEALDITVKYHNVIHRQGGKPPVTAVAPVISTVDGGNTDTTPTPATPSATPALPAPQLEL